MVANIFSKDHANGAEAAAATAATAAEPSQAQLEAAHVQDQREELALSAQLQQNAAKGARVMEFAEDATPEQKAAEAAKAINKVRPAKGLGRHDDDAGHAMASDIGGKKVKVTTNLDDDVERLNRQEHDAPGAMPVGQATSTLPDWYQVGWTGVSRHLRGLEPNKVVSEDEEARLDLISTFLSDAYYGYFWWNAAVIVVAVLSSYFVARFGGGIGWLVIIGAFCSTYYNTSMRRTRTRARDDITRELAKKKMISEHESAEWINHFLSRFWLIYEPVLSATIIGTVDGILVQQCPSFLDSIRMTTFTLGTKAPRIDHVRTFPNTDEDVVMMDWKFSFTPSDTADLTVRQAAQKINPKIVLTVRVGRGLVGAGMPILLEDINFVGNIRVKMKLMSSFPHVQLVDVSFMEPPKIDYVLKPIGGNTLGFDIGNIPGLSDFIQGQIHANLGPMMYHPNVFTVNLEELMSGTPLDTACGVLQVNVWSARNLKGVKLGGGTPDPYVALSIDNKDTLAKTSVRKSTTSPQFKETRFVLLNNLNGMLTFSLLDHNDHRPDSNLGQAAFELKSLEDDPEQENLSTPVMLDGKERGEVQYSLSYYPVLKAEVGEDGQPKPLPETQSGVVRFTLHQAKELDKRSGFSGELCPKARIRLNGQKVKDSIVMKRTTNPIFEMPTEFLVTERSKAVVTVEILDDRDLRSDPVVAHVSIRLEDLLAAKQRQQDWFPLKDSKQGRVRMSAEWKPVLMSGSMNGGGGYTPAIGVVKVWLKRATDLKNVEAMTGGKSDPYVQLKLRGQAVSGSTIVNNNLNPEWNEILYCPVHSLRERITVEVMDYQNSGKDRSLGTVEVNVADLAVENEAAAAAADARSRYAGTGRKARKDRVHLGRNLYKGEIEFDCEFLPGVNLKGVSFSGAGNEAAAKSGNAIIEEEDEAASSSSSSSSDEEEAARIKEVAKPTTGVNGTANGVDRQASVKRGHTKDKPSVASVATAGTAETAQTAASASVESVVEGGISMTKDELLAQQSGIIVFNVLRGSLPSHKKHARLEVLFDDGYWPSYVTEQARTAHCTWDEVGESTVRELDWSRFLLKLRTGDDDDDVFAEFAAPTKDVLEKTLDQEYEFRLTSAGGSGSQVASVTLTCRYIPIDLHLEPVESVNNQGFLRVDVVRARNLRAADRGNRSDPYVVFHLNGERMAKSKVVKKTLNPDYNENLGEFQVPSRVAADAIVEALDWDQVGTPDKLGQAQVDLSVLEPFEPFEHTYPLVGKGSTEKSEVTLRFVFRPEFVTNRERKGTSLSRTFTSGVAGVGRVGVGGVKGVAHAGGAVGKAGFGVGKGVVGVAGKGVGGVTRGVGGFIRPGGRKTSISGAGEVVEQDMALDPATGEPVLVAPAAGVAASPPLQDGLPSVSSSSLGMPFHHHAAAAPPVPHGDEGSMIGSHSRLSSSNAGAGDADSRSVAETEGTPGKKKSRLHNPFKRHG